MPLSTFPKISIITPNYNGERFLEQTIVSILSQNYPNLEYIIIDGGSTDRSVDIIKKYEKDLAYWVSEPDSGMYDAIQKGFDKSSGDIMAWINSDDKYHFKALFSVSEIFNQFEEVNWIMGTPNFYDKEGRTMVNAAHLYPSWSKIRFYNYDFKWIQQESVFWRREVWNKIGETLNTSLKYAGDAELWLRFFRHEKLYCVPHLLGGFRVLKDVQLSEKFRDQYLKEINNSIKEERKNISLGNKILCFVISIDRILIRIPFINRVYYRTGIRNYLHFPKRLFYERSSDGLQFE